MSTSMAGCCVWLDLGTASLGAQLRSLEWQRASGHAAGRYAFVPAQPPRIIPSTRTLAPLLSQMPR